MINLAVNTTSLWWTLLRRTVITRGLPTIITRWLLACLRLERLRWIIRHHIIRCYWAYFQLRRYKLVNLLLIVKVVRPRVILSLALVVLIRIIIPLLTIELLLDIVVLRNELAKAALVCTWTTVVLLTSLPAMWLWQSVVNIAMVGGRGWLESGGVK